MSNFHSSAIVARTCHCWKGLLVCVTAQEILVCVTAQVIQPCSYMSMKKEIVELLKNLAIEGNLLSLKFSIWEKKKDLLQKLKEAEKLINCKNVTDSSEEEEMEKSIKEFEVFNGKDYQLW